MAIDGPQKFKDSLREGKLLTSEMTGISTDRLAHMEREGYLERVAPAVYISADTLRHPLVDVAGWTLRHPEVVACLLTAAVFHDLTDAFTGGLWLMSPRGRTGPRSRRERLIVVYAVEKYIHPSLDEQNDIFTIHVHGVDVRVTGPDRTVVDLWRQARNISSEYALEALRRRARSSDFRPAKFARLARRYNAWGRIAPVMQGLSLK